MKFNRMDLDVELIYTRAFEEAKGIYSYESRRRGRTFDVIFDNCVQGQTAEVFLLTQGYTSNPDKYGDVINPAGEPVEVKTVKSTSAVSNVITKCNENKLTPYRNYPKHIYVFHADINNDYRLYGKYMWNGCQYELNSSDNYEEPVDINTDPDYFVLDLPKKCDGDSIAKIFMYHKNKEKAWVKSNKPLKIVEGDKILATVNCYDDLMLDFAVSEIMRSYRPNLWFPTYAMWKRGLMKLYDNRFAKCNNGMIKLEKELVDA